MCVCGSLIEPPRASEQDQCSNSEGCFIMWGTTMQSNNLQLLVCDVVAAYGIHRTWQPAGVCESGGPSEWCGVVR